MPNNIVQSQQQRHYINLHSLIAVEIIYESLRMDILKKPSEQMSVQSQQ